MSTLGQRTGPANPPRIRRLQGDPFAPQRSGDRPIVLNSSSNHHGGSGKPEIVPLFGRQSCELLNRQPGTSPPRDSTGKRSEHVDDLTVVVPKVVLCFFASFPETEAHDTFRVPAADAGELLLLSGMCLTFPILVTECALTSALELPH
jgi:hypothetical protein